MKQYLHIETESHPTGITQNLTTNNYHFGCAIYYEALNFGLDAEIENVSESVRIWFFGSLEIVALILAKVVSHTHGDGDL